MAQVCTPENGYWGYDYVVNTQSEADAIAQSCTTINGSLIMYANYRGAFHLPNVRNMLGSLQWRSLLADPYSPDEPSPTTIDVPDLELVRNSVYMGSLPALGSFSAPRLRSVGWSVQLDYAVDVDLRALEEAEYFSYTGNVSALNPSAKCVKVRASVTRIDAWKTSRQTTHSASRLHPYLLPGAVELDGRYSGTTAYSFAIDSVRNLTGSFNLITSAPLNVTFPFEEAVYVYLAGNITGSWESLTVDSRLEIDCDATTDSLANTTAHSYTCRSTTPGSGSGLTTGAKAGIGVGAAVGGLVILGAAEWCVARWKKQTANREQDLQRVVTMCGDDTHLVFDACKND
ncbi:hypothetical protein BJX68DRAFT_261704 [Aspergillus pseudodeflectus]|uniref:Uncharacterized protein n=1 Tax=Aspergillus pseudodeflectus TaxID=176178 RepID=A0ABR4L451_9EURO